RRHYGAIAGSALHAAGSNGARSRRASLSRHGDAHRANVAGSAGALRPVTRHTHTLPLPPAIASCVPPVDQASLNTNAGSCGDVASSEPVAASHSQTRRSLSVAISVPSGLNAIAVIGAVLGCEKVRSRAPLCASAMETIPLMAPAA